MLCFCFNMTAKKQRFGRQCKQIDDLFSCRWRTVSSHFVRDLMMQRCTWEILFKIMELFAPSWKDNIVVWRMTSPQRSLNISRTLLQAALPRQKYTCWYFPPSFWQRLKKRGAQGRTWTWCVWLLHLAIWISVTDNALFTLSISYKVAELLFPVFVTQPTPATDSHFIHSCDGFVCWCSCQTYWT